MAQVLLIYIRKKSPWHEDTLKISFERLSFEFLETWVSEG